MGRSHEEEPAALQSGGHCTARRQREVAVQGVVNEGVQPHVARIQLDVRARDGGTSLKGCRALVDPPE